MTALKLLDNSLALLLTSSSGTPEYTASALPVINMLLAETRQYNEILRRQKGKKPLEDIPCVFSLEDELPCEDELAMTALPNALCAKLLMDDDDLAKVAYFQNQYVSACESAARCVAEPVKDIYPAGEE